MALNAITPMYRHSSFRLWYQPSTINRSICCQRDPSDLLFLYKLITKAQNAMMTSSNGNIFRVTGHLYGKFTGHRWIPHLEFPAQKRVIRSFDVLFDLRLNKRLSKQSGSWSFETPSCSSWRHRNATNKLLITMAVCRVQNSIHVVKIWAQSIDIPKFDLKCLRIVPIVCVLYIKGPVGLMNHQRPLTRQVKIYHPAKTD